MLQILGISLLLLAIVTIEKAYFILPIYAIIAEMYSFYLDSIHKPLKKAKPTNHKSYTQAELNEHNTDSSVWVAVDGIVYDMTEYVDKHPGGKEFMLLHAGRDVSVPFVAYHSFTEKPRQIIQKFVIGELKDYDKPQYPKDSGFYKECQQRIKLYFKENNLDSKDPLPGLIRQIPLVAVMGLTFYYAFICQSTSFNARLVLAITFGVSQALNTMHLMHDASHGAIGSNELWWWSVGRITLDWMTGSSLLAWHNQHIVGHHAYTNIMGADPDVPTKEEGDVRRILRKQRWSKMYEWQVYYMPVLYGLFSFRSRWYDIFEIFMKETNGPIKINPISIQDKLRQSASKIFWFFWRICLPLKYYNQDITTFIICFIVTELTMGYWLGFNFQVSHISDEVEFFEDKDTVKEEWAHLQVKTSLDYGHNSWVYAYMTGALNYQIEHHLFPGVSQYHYPQIAPIIKEVCAKHNIKYNLVPGAWEALAGHFRHLKKLGNMHQWVPIEN